VTYLNELLTRRTAAVEKKKTELPLEALRNGALGRADVRDFELALRYRSPAIIAEFKRASPSAGDINVNADVQAVVRAYERGGAVALSVLTEPELFRGSFDDLRSARSAVALPVLCKDFIVDGYQIWEAAAEGADAVLLIAAALDDRRLREFLKLVQCLGLSALVEVHDEDEAARALSARARIIGVNNRDLHSFGVDVETALRVRRMLPDSVVVVAESGYRTAEEVGRCFRSGVHAVLIGESLMRAGDPAAAVAGLRGAAR
jgi:indole-3-glycerol phosphate synthase